VAIKAHDRFLANQSYIKEKHHMIQLPYRTYIVERNMFNINKNNKKDIITPHFATSEGLFF